MAIFGSTGQLGSDLVDVLCRSNSFDVIPITHENADCTDARAVRKILLSSRPQIVVNSAAFVRVDECEDHIEEAFRVNAIGAYNIAKLCSELDAFCIYISTDYVFDGKKPMPYVESDAAFPINVYGVSKLAGELLVRQTVPHWLVVRAASLFGSTGARGKGGNFVETILGKAKRSEPLKVVNDVRMSPTYTRDAAEALVGLISAGATGIVHVTNNGACPWYEFARAIWELAGLSTPIDPLTSKGYPTRARRPTNSVLRSERSLVKCRAWRDALQAYLVEKGHIATSLAVTPR